MKVKILFASFLFFMGIQPMSAQTRQQEMDRFIDNLMSQMTLQEKIGQLNLPVTGDIVTGQARVAISQARYVVAKWVDYSTSRA